MVSSFHNVEDFLKKIELTSPDNLKYYIRGDEVPSSDQSGYLLVRFLNEEDCDDFVYESWLYDEDEQKMQNVFFADPNYCSDEVLKALYNQIMMTYANRDAFDKAIQEITENFTLQ